MRRTSKLISLVIAIGWLVTFVKADIPPDAGYTRVKASLILETVDDLSDYRFFLESSLGIEELEISNGEAATVDANRRAVASRVATLWAIPRKSIDEEFGISATEKLDGMRAPLREGRINGAVNLLSHSFLATIRDGEKANWKDPVYRIEESPDKGIIAILISGGEKSVSSGLQNGVSFSLTDASKKLTLLGWGLVVGGIVMILAIASFGLWRFIGFTKKDSI